MYISIRYEARQYCAFRSSKCRFSSNAAASLAGCVFRVRTLPSILFRMVVMCPLHLAIFLEISGAVAFLHSLFMRAIVASDKVADAILIFLLRCDLPRLCYLRCLATSSSAPAWTSFYLCLLSGTFNLFYLQISVRMRHVTFADSYLRANIEFRNKACTRGKYYSYTSVYFMLSLFIYVYRHIYVHHVLAVALASLP